MLTVYLEGYNRLLQDKKLLFFTAFFTDPQGDDEVSLYLAFEKD